LPGAGGLRRVINADGFGLETGLLRIVVPGRHVERLVDVSNQVHDHTNRLELRKSVSAARSLQNLDRLHERVYHVVWANATGRGVVRRRRVVRVSRRTQGQVDEVPLRITRMVLVEVIGLLHVIGRPSRGNLAVYRAIADVVEPGGDPLERAG